MGPVIADELRLPGFCRAWGDQTVVVQGIGGELPIWSERIAESGIPARLELIVVRDDLASVEPGTLLMEPAYAYSRAIVYSSGAMAATENLFRALPRADLVIETRPEDLEVIAETIVHIATSEAFICFDWADAMAIAGRTALRAAIGAGVVVSGMGANAGRAVHQVSDHLATRGFGAGVFVCQFVSVRDMPAFSLVDVDSMATAAGLYEHRHRLLTCYLDQRRTEVVVVAFRH